MATASKKVAETAGIVIEVLPADIRVPERLGALHPDKGAAIGKLMLRDGQHEPIKIKRNGPRAEYKWDLVAGEHRHYGATVEGLILKALEVEGDEVTLRQIEASENIERASRSPLERASFVRAIADAAEARLKDQHGDLSPQEIGIRKRWEELRTKAPGVERDETLNDAEAEHSGVNFTRLYGWRAETAAAIGMSVESVKKDLALHRALIAPFPDRWRDLATHPTVGDNASALREIASYAVDARREIIEGLLEAPEMTLQQALDGLGLTQPKAAAATGATKFMNNAGSNISRLTESQQRQFIPVLLQALKPKALAELVSQIEALRAQGGAA